MVVGGWNKTGRRSLKSTEILTMDAPPGVWEFVGDLPAAQRGLAGAKIDNTIFMSG